MGEVVSIGFNKTELSKALELLCGQGYFSEYEVRLGQGVARTEAKIAEALAVAGWDGKIQPHATDCGPEGWIQSFFDPDLLTTALVDELIRDEAEAQRGMRP